MHFPILVFWRTQFYEEPVTSQVLFEMVSNMILVMGNCFIVYLAVTKFGIYYMECDILRQGNENLLNNLDEGVII